MEPMESISKISEDILDDVSERAKQYEELQTPSDLIVSDSDEDSEELAKIFDLMNMPKETYKSPEIKSSDGSDDKEGKKAEEIDKDDNSTEQFLIPAQKLTFKYTDEVMEISGSEEKLDGDKSATEEINETDDQPIEDMINDSENIDELQIISKKKKKVSYKRKSRLPERIEGLMGQANICYVRGENDEAIKMCKEVIRWCPDSFEPYLTLGLIYKSMGKMEKALEYSMLSAYLQPRDQVNWFILANMSEEQKNFKHALNCYSNGIKCNPDNVVLLWRRCKLLEQLGDTKKALIGYQTIVQKLKPEHGVLCVRYTREIVKIYCGKGNVPAAIQAMDIALSRCPSRFTLEDVDLMLELQISQERYKDAILVIVKQCNVIMVNFKDEVISLLALLRILESETLNEIKSLQIPESVPIGLKDKLVVCLNHLKAYHLI